MVTGFSESYAYAQLAIYLSKIDADGATGVRLSFNPRTGKQDAHKEKKSEIALMIGR
jgi:hypothetical protein